MSEHKSKQSADQGPPRAPGTIIVAIFVGLCALIGVFLWKMMTHK